VNKKESTFVSTLRAATNDDSNTSNLNSQQPVQATGGQDVLQVKKTSVNAGGVNSIRQSHVTMKPL
jgi:hypothetical protein